MIRWRTYASVLATALCAGFRCSSPNSSAGTTNTGNARLAAVYASGAPAAGALVRLRRSDYVTPVSSLAKQTGIVGADAVTDSAGRFEIAGVEPGQYRIEVSDPALRQALLRDCSVEAGDTAELGVDTLRPCAVVIGAVDTAGTPGVQYFVQVAGLERLALAGGDGRYVLADLPAGHYSLRIGPGGPPLSVRGVEAVPGDTSVAASPLPARWSAVSIGAETPRGGAMYAGGRFVIAGGGPDIWDSTDGFHFVYQPWSGDGEMVARVAAFEYGARYSKAAVMFRETLDPRSVNVTASIEIDSSGADVFCIHHRLSASGPSAVACGVYGHRAPQWIRLVRSGDVFTAAVSPDGAAWTETCSDTVAMARDALAGMAVTSHDRARLSTAEFEHVTIR